MEYLFSLEIKFKKVVVIFINCFFNPCIMVVKIWMGEEGDFDFQGKSGGLVLGVGLKENVQSHDEFLNVCEREDKY